MENTILKAFIDAMNDHDTNLMLKYLHKNHELVDAQGTHLRGRDDVIQAWIAYFLIFPDYKMEVTEVFTEGNSYALFGFASGSHDDPENDAMPKFWNIPAAWKVITDKKSILSWQVYADTRLPYESLYIINKI